MSKNNENTVSLETAEEWTAEWRETCPDNCKAFLIPAIDLVEVLNDMGILGKSATKKAKEKANDNNLDVRAYMAIGSEDGGPDEERLLIVATQEVDGVYRDILDGTIDGEPVTCMVRDDSESGIYDFTSPCPNTCDDQSPLNG